MPSGLDTRQPARCFLGNGFRKSKGVGLVLLGLVLAGCASFPQVYSSTHYRLLGLTHADLVAGGVAFLTPSTVTGESLVNKGCDDRGVQTPSDRHDERGCET